jgi:hypothetical protein
VLHDGGRGRVTIARILPGGRWHQWSVPAAELAYAVRDLAGRYDVFLTQNRFWTRRRRTVDLAQLNALFCDLDFYRTVFADLSPGQALDAALLVLNGAAIPLPSIAISSGRGLCLIWLHTPVPRDALPRWRLCQRRILEALQAFGADPKATDATRVLRLIGSINSKSSTFVEAITPAAPPWPFDALADQILPYTRAQIDLLRAERAERPAARDACIRNGHPTLAGFHAATLWQGRLDELERLLRHRWFGTLPPGHRDGWLFTAGIAASYLTIPSKLRAELFHLARRVSPWSDNETHHRLTCVIQRAEAAGRGECIEWHGHRVDPRYRLCDETIVRWLNITEQEMVALDFRHLLTPELKRARKRTYWHLHRAAQGRLSRDVYLAAAIERHANAAELRARGLTWESVGDLMGISAGAARKLAQRHDSHKRDRSLPLYDGEASPQRMKG